MPTTVLARHAVTRLRCVLGLSLCLPLLVLLTPRFVVRSHAILCLCDCALRAIQSMETCPELFSEPTSELLRPKCSGSGGHRGITNCVGDITTACVGSETTNRCVADCLTGEAISELLPCAVLERGGYGTEATSDQSIPTVLPSRV